MFAEFELSDRLLKAIEKLGFQQPTEVQQKAIPLALAGKDLKVSAETGSGKTVAFLLPTLERLLRKDAPKSGTRALILVPTRELARQVYKHFTALTGLTHLKAAIIMGGEDFKYQKSLFRKNPEIIIATPGRLLEHLEHQIPDFNELEVLILDEADRMLDMGLSEDVLKIAEQCPANRQTLLFSATLRHKGINHVTAKVLRNPEELLLNNVREQHSNIHQQIILADDAKHKSNLCAWLGQNETFTKAMIFTNTKAQADSLCGILRYKDLRAGVLHGDLDQETRKHVLDLFRRGQISVLVASDVAARGLDIKGVDLVINFDMPRSGNEYVHRIGRTGRAGEQGLAISLISPTEWNLMSSIERFLKLKFEHRKVKALEGKFKGPKKLKASGKAAGPKKKKSTGKAAATKAKANKKPAKPKAASSETNNRSDIRERPQRPERSRSDAPGTERSRTPANQDGFAPPKRKKKPSPPTH